MEDTWFVCSVILTGVCISTVVTELCPDQSTPGFAAVNFCVDTTAEDKKIIYIGTEKAPKYANNNCTCTITALNLRSPLSVNLKEIADTSNISFVRQDGSSYVISRSSTISISLTGVVQVIYQSAASDLIDPICLKLDAHSGTFSVTCAASRRFIDTNSTSTSSPTITDTTQASRIEKGTINTNTTSFSSSTITDTTQASGIEHDIKDKPHTSPNSHTITSKTDTTQDSTIMQAIAKNKDDTIVLLGPIIGGICAVIVITVAVIVLVVVVRRRRKHDKQNPSQTDYDITTENPIYDRDGTPNDKTNIQNDSVHYNTVQLSDDEYAEPYTRSETNQNVIYSKVDKTARHRKGNTSRNTPHNQEHTDNYDRTDVKREIQPFNEYNHLSTVHRPSQDALGDYDRTNIHLTQINEGHDADAGTYNTAFSH